MSLKQCEGQFGLLQRYIYVREWEAGVKIIKGAQTLTEVAI